MTINILGAGSWGLALSHLLTKNNYKVKIWSRNKNKIVKFTSTRSYSKLPKYIINPNVTFTSNLSKLNFNNITIIAIPSNGVYETLKSINSLYCNLLICTKGFDPESSKLLSDLLVENLNISINKIAVMSGPNHAEEIVQNKPSATVIASKNDKLVSSLQLLFSSEIFRVYKTSDLIGVQVGGAIKNIISIASGICSSLNLGDNIIAALITRGLHEMITLNKIYNLDNDTLYGLSGIGDLMATAYSQHSRNRRFGELIGTGISVNDALESIDATVEGLLACKIINKLKISNGLNLPICTEVYNILYNHSDPKKSISNLMLRKLKNEK
jgi:glycerol-3-phosphate dehydrogenase (NAD(P)+)